MRFEIDWQAPFETESPEAITFASLRLTVGGATATAVEDSIAQTIREEIFVSIYPLAWFLVENWWRLRWEPAPSSPSAAWKLRHSLAAVGDGYNWPDLEFASDGEAILAQMRAGSASDTSPIRYVRSLSEWIQASDFERFVDSLLETIAGRLDARRYRDTDLQRLLDELRNERSDPEFSRWRQLEAMAGYDPDEAPEEFIAALVALTDEIGWSTLQELTAHSRERALEDIVSLTEVLKQRGTDFQITELNSLRESVANDVGNTTNPPWVRAAEAAHKTRQHFGLNGESISSRRLAEIFDVSEAILANSEPAVAPCSASLNAEDNGRDELVIDKRLPSSRRFAVCRLLGDRLYATRENGRLSAATDAATARQKFQRAFAQELLCPFDALKAAIGRGPVSDDKMETAAEHFGVSPLLIRSTLVNRGMISRDRLEDQF